MAQRSHFTRETPLGTLVICTFATATQGCIYNVQGQHEGRRLLVTGNKRASLNTQKTCMAEDICVSKSCGHAYDRTATNFPFTIGYEKKMNSGSTTFDFKVGIG